MICPHCQFSNPDSARFCMNCGKPLLLTCTNCGTNLPNEARFCFNCGFPVENRQAPVSASAEPAVSNPPGRMENPIAVASQPPVVSRTLSGERRVITILFCDVKGSTAAAELLDPEEWTELIQQIFERLIAAVTNFEGNVARLMGDAILAFFGAPVAHEDDPQRAVLAGLEIVESIRQFKEQALTPRGIELDVRVGINTGLTVVGEIGTDLRMEYTAMGDAVNVAARMEQTAQPGTVQISQETYYQVSHLFEVEDLGGIEVKGKSEPIAAYRVLRRAEATQSPRHPGGRQTVLVGRKAEQKAFQTILSDLGAGRGQIVCVVGEAGIGKSRLLSEMRHLWESSRAQEGRDETESWDWIECSSPSLTSGSPYATFRQLIRTMCGMAENDPAEVVRQKIRECCLQVILSEDQRAQVQGAFEILLGVQGAAETDQVGGDDFKRNLFAVMTLVWEQIASRSPTVLVFDDLHWADQASIDLIIHICHVVERAPLLIVSALRPERSAPAWQLRSEAERSFPHRFISFNLQALSGEESEALVHELLPVADLPHDLRDSILAKTEGNPFFIEEVIQSLIENGALVLNEEQSGELVWKYVPGLAEINLPDTIQTLILSRVDRLEDGPRQSLQLAAVIGRTFSYPILEKLVQDPGRLSEHLGTLERAELVRETARQPFAEYTFRHALTQETVYKAILNKQRRRYHLLVGEALESQFQTGCDVQESCSMLAHHFDQAGDERALGYYLNAGDHALRLYATREAIAAYSRAIKLARPNTDSGTLMHLYLQRGRAMELGSANPEAIANYVELEGIARKRDDEPLLLGALTAHATLLSTPSQVHDMHLARKLLDESLDLAKKLDDKAAQARVLWILLLLNDRFGNPSDGIAFGEQALELARQLDLREQTAFILNDLSQAYYNIGRFGLGLNVSEQAIQIWSSLGNKAMLADGLATSVFALYMAGDFEKAIQRSMEAHQISLSIGNLWGQGYSLMYVGLVYYDRGEPSKAIEIMQDSIQLSDQAGFLGPRITTRTDLVRVLTDLGAFEKAYAELEMALQETSEFSSFWRAYVIFGLVYFASRTEEMERAKPFLQELKEKFNNLPSQGVIDLLAISSLILESLADEDYETALNFTGKAIDDFGEHLPVIAADLLLLHSRALMGLGRVEEALAALHRARSMCESFGIRRLLWEILADLADLELSMGNTESAATLSTQAAEIVGYIRDHIDDPGMRNSYLNIPRISKILSAAEQPAEI